FPNSAPDKNFSFKIGPDFIPPVISHNPQKIIAENLAEFEIKALTSDNLGVNSVKVEYKINGILQSPVNLKLSGNESYSGIIQFNNEQFKNGHFEYRIVAQDNSSAGNKKHLPSSGFYSVCVFKPQTPVKSYSSDFESGSSDFVNSDFTVSRVVGFSGNVLHTIHPYPVSALKDEKHNLIAQLSHPVILQEGGEMHFDEVVLVEPGEKGTNFLESLFWDYVVVEGSKDNGTTWIPFSPGYDSGANEYWETSFLSSTVNNKSQAVGNENMFLKNRIRLTDNTGFFAGDTVLFRFRLASDNSLNGWGWAIDNLEIQTTLPTDSDLIVQKSIQAYPNPFNDKFFLDFSAIENHGQIHIILTDIIGKTIYKKENISFFGNPESIELPGASSGIYILKITDGKKELFAGKMIKR
ncbi:MAG: T9SS type A sorting domain-containing protein, partial [Prolixibacteraceae bacterium]|nr:T9SS type A sorting domain-containing protein [Prolixibacteraceae bacterium]